jgi:hypothetical protein
MKIVQFEDRSPFYKLVNLTEKNSGHLIGYKTMVRIANGWYRAKEPFFTYLLASLYPDITGTSYKSRRREKWKSEDWGKFFLDYWTLVRSVYGSVRSHVPGKNLWDVGDSQLMVAIVLLEFQNVFFESLSDQDDDFFKVEGAAPLVFLREKLKNRATKLFESFPKELFQVKWETSSLNIGAGKAALKRCFYEMKKNKGHWDWKQSALVDGIR